MMQTTLTPDRASCATTAPSAGEFLSFRLGDSEYGIDILKVQEIRSHEAPTPIPNAPPAVSGVINLRGVIVPLVDLRLKLGCARADPTPATVVIVLAVRGLVLGAIVDSVNDVVALSADEIHAAHPLRAGLQTPAINGIGCQGERLLVLLDIEALMSEDDIGVVDVSH